MARWAGDDSDGLEERPVYYPGEIVGVKARAYDVLYDDGVREADVPASMIRNETAADARHKMWRILHWMDNGPDRRYLEDVLLPALAELRPPPRRILSVGVAQYALKYEVRRDRPDAGEQGSRETAPAARQPGSQAARQPGSQAARRQASSNAAWRAGSLTAAQPRQAGPAGRQAGPGRPRQGNRQARRHAGEQADRPRQANSVISCD